MCGFIAQLVAHRTSATEVTSSNPGEALFYFFQASPFQLLNVLVNSKTAHAPPPAPPGQTPWHLTVWKNFGQIPRYVASLDGQMLTR